MSTPERVAVITGASSGIGAATAVALAEAGFGVVLMARRADRLDDIAGRVREVGGTALAVAGDVARRADVDHVVTTTMEQWGRIDVLLNNAGIMPLAPMTKCRMDDWDATFDVNVKGLLSCIGLTLPIMLAQGTGHIVNVSSVAGRKLFPAATVYCASKFAVHAISEGLRTELAEYAKTDGNAIRVTVVAPGLVTTELTDSIRDDETRDASRAYYGSLPGPLVPDDIATSIVYAVTAPPHVGVNEIVVRPTTQVR